MASGDDGPHVQEGSSGPQGAPRPGWVVAVLYRHVFIQQPVKVRGAQVLPVGPGGLEGDIRTAERLLSGTPLALLPTVVEEVRAHFREHGFGVVILFDPLFDVTNAKAIDTRLADAEPIIGATAVTSANPAILVCAIAYPTSLSAAAGPTLFFDLQLERRIVHSTNVPGLLQALPIVADAAKQSTKLQLLLNLFRSSLEQRNHDLRLLMHLILLEEASDAFKGTLAQRLTNLFSSHGITGDIESVPERLGQTLPDGRTVVDLLVKLRNAAAHNGEITPDTLAEYNGSWVVPLIADKAKLHSVVSEVVRLLLLSIAGFTRDTHALRVTLEPGQSFEVKFD